MCVRQFLTFSDLTALVTSSQHRLGDAAFGKEFAIAEVSKEAQDDAKGRKLWELSEKLVGA